MRNEAVEYIAHLLLKRAAQYEKSGDYAYCSGDAGTDREAATLLLAGDNLSQAIEECARMVDEYNDQSETGDTLTMLAENMRAKARQPVTHTSQECDECPSGDCSDCPRKPARWTP